MNRKEEIRSLKHRRVEHSKKGNSRRGWVGTIGDLIVLQGRTKVNIHWENGVVQPYELDAIQLPEDGIYDAGYLRLLKDMDKNISWLIVNTQGKVAALAETEDQANELAHKEVVNTQRMHYVCKTVRTMELSAPPVKTTETNV
ncbi:putative N-acetyltransferase [Alteromonas phage vB_AspP-H4/4]|uniref:N-acetyltransferase n=1 Tax=Alteromonas phage vB_AspP-H4/4 TaxID=2928692 RepID=A0A220YL49_9CAUD|nr:putative N-acetyltransferase [Alteromonas phage vB_AspP-H4/4]ASL24397.1 putative N-acetyltransferase [Alteromonas phage vB_AspP-H4/4]